VNSGPMACALEHPGMLEAVEASLQGLLAGCGAGFAIHRRTGDLAVEVIGVATGCLHLEFDPDASPAEVRDTVEAALEHFLAFRHRSSRR
jgi:hypothetical protein